MLALGVESGRVMLVDEATGGVKWEVEAHIADTISDVLGQQFPHLGYWVLVAISPDGRFVASVELEHPRWKLWDTASGVVHMVGATHDGAGACICAVDGRGLLVVQEGCPVVAHTGGLRAVAFSPCGQRFATGGEDGAVIVWDIQSGEAERRMVEEDVWEVRTSALCFSASGARLASGGSKRVWDEMEYSICVWDTTGALLLWKHEAEKVESLHFSPTNENQLVIGTGREVSLWDVENGNKIWSIVGYRFAVFSPDSRSIACGGANASDVHLVDAHTGEFRLNMVGPSAYFSCAAFSVDGSELVLGSYAGTCGVRDSSTGTRLRTINGEKRISSVASGRDWVRDTLGAAFAMGHHPRLGAGSWVLELEAGVVQMILDRL